MSTWELAQRLAKWGFSVIPLDHPERPVARDPHQVGKVPAIKWEAYQKRHPSAEELQAWFDAPAKHNIAIVSGAISNIVVVDLDSDAALDWAIAHLPSTPMRVRTGRGEHWYYRYPGSRIRNRVRVVTTVGELEIDLRGDGGYVVAPGSQHHTGRIYRAPEPWPASLETVPAFCSSWFGAGEQATLAAAEEPEAVTPPSSIGEGQRNAHLASLAGAMRQHGAEEGVILAALREENQSRCHPPLSDAEVATVATSIASYPTAALSHEQNVKREVERQRARRDAGRRLDAEERGPKSTPAFATLRERLARPRPAIHYRIQGWQPVGSRVILAAQFKAGKTTVVGNLIRSLVDGDPWLGAATVAPVTGRLLLIDFEMAPSQLDAWYEAQAVCGDDRVIVESMRGQAAAFNILDATVRSFWAEQIRARNITYLILDCLRPILDGLALDENSEAGKFLVAFDALLHEAGVTEALIVHHMGHAGERSRGDSRLRDWPDAEWRLIRQDADDSGSPRFITAFGRDVDVRESQLIFDAETRQLTLAGGSRHDAKVLEALDAILGVIDGADQPLTTTAISDAVMKKGSTRAAVEAALKQGVKSGVLLCAAGARNAKLYSRAPVSQCPAVPRQCTGSLPVSVPVPIGTGHTHMPEARNEAARKESLPEATDPSEWVGYVRV